MAWIKEDPAEGDWGKALGIRKEIFRYFESNLYPLKLNESFISDFITELKLQAGFIEEVSSEFFVEFTDFIFRISSLPVTIPEEFLSSFTVNLTNFELKKTRIDEQEFEEYVSTLTPVLSSFILVVAAVRTTQTEEVQATLTPVLSSFILG